MQKRKLTYSVVLFALVIPLMSSALDIAPRPQSANVARQIAGWVHELFVYRPDECDSYHSMMLTYEYGRTRNSRQIAQCLFGNALDNSCQDAVIAIQGSQVANRSPNAWLADYFGLPTDFNSSVRVQPRITNHILELGYFSDLSQWCDGLWFRAYFPLVHTTFKLHYNETIQERGANGYPAGYFTDGAVPRGALLDSFSDYVTGHAPRLETGLNLATGSVNANNLVSFEPLSCSKWFDSCCENPHKTALSDIYLLMGYDIWECECYHFALGLMATVPTGNRHDGEFLFSPLVGNGHHWGVGLVTNGSYNMWQSECSERAIDFYFEGRVIHQFKDRQCCSFDLRNGCNSRYMLASRFGTPVEGLSGNGSDTDTGVNQNGSQIMQQFTNVYAPVANLTKTALDVSYGVMNDWAFLLSYTSACGDMYFDLGYNLWTRSCTKLASLSDCECQNRIKTGQWALKGDAQMFGYATMNIADGVNCLSVPFCNAQDGTAIATSATALSATQKCASIASGRNAAESTDAIAAVRNPGVDNKEFAQSGPNGAASVLVSGPGVVGADNQIFTSVQPNLLTMSDIDVCGARQKSFTNSIFANLTYTWCACECREPFFGFGGRVEWGRNDDKCNVVCRQNRACDLSACPSKNDCRECSLSQWGVWVKAGVTFN